MDKFFSTPDINLMLCFVNWAAVSITDNAWHQAQLTLRKGWLGLRSISHHVVLQYCILLDIVVQVMCIFRYAVDVYNNQALVSNRITIHITGPSSYPHHWPFLISTSLALPHIHITGPSSYPHHWPFLISTSLALPHIHITGPSSYPHHWPFLISTSLALPHIHITGPSSYPHHWPFLISTSLALPHIHITGPSSYPHHWPFLIEICLLVWMTIYSSYLLIILPS